VFFIQGADIWQTITGQRYTMPQDFGTQKNGEIMQTAKEEVMEVLRGLPDSSTLEEIQYHLYVRQKVECGMRDIEEGKTYTQEEVERRMQKWL